MTAQNGESATLKKRKRDKHDEERKAGKRRRSKSKGQVNGDSAGLAVKDTGDESAMQAQLQVKAENHSTLSNSEPETYGHGKTGPVWRVSNPMGGRILDIDPIFSQDEQHLIITYNTSLQVYSTADSLLVRRVDLPLLRLGGEPEKASACIVSSALSKSSPNFVWVACSDGRVWYIDWTSGTGTETTYTLHAKKVCDITVGVIRIGKTVKDVLFVLQKRRLSGSAQIVAYDDQALAAQSGIRLHRCQDGPQILRCALDGNVIAAATKEEVHIGFLKPKSGDVQSIADLEYQFCSFGVNDVITCLDLRCSARAVKRGNKGSPVVDLAVGCARGSIYLYSDVLSRIMSAGSSVQPLKYHWHRKAVHSVKWSQDGNYLVSGGSETVLVLWQLDTGKRDFLPHLSASIENVVVSPRGSSYAVHLDDNSVMVLSTAEMKPTTFISGIQSLVLNDRSLKDSRVRRVWNGAEDISTPLAATNHPTERSLMLLCVGSGQQASLGEGSPSTPLVQAFDLASFQSISKHALARTMVTENNITNQGHPIVEPRVTAIAFSHDGKWLASVDEWHPPERDMDLFVDGIKTAGDACMERQEIYLKFWEVNSKLSSVDLVTRVDEVHHTTKPEKIFDLACHPTSTRFATVGGDGAVKLWTPRLLKSDGLAVRGPEGQALKMWSCSQTILLSESPCQQDGQSQAGGIEGPESGAVAFSEDGSVLFAAFGGPSGATVYIIDADSGEIREKLGGLFRGDVRAMKALSSCLVMLSEDLTVYDIVADELRYGFSLPDSLGPAIRLAQLAVNPRSQSFAVAVPLPKPGREKLQNGSASELTIFSVDDSQPQLVQQFPRLITSVLPATRSAGFIVVDAAAQIWSITEGADQVPFVQPLTNMNLDDEQQQSAMQTEDADFMVNGEDGAASDEEMQVDEQDDEMEDDDPHPAVIAPQRLADIFNAAPPFAMPPIEDMFFQVTKLFSPQPSSADVTASG